jgi:hypothetical protein
VPDLGGSAAPDLRQRRVQIMIRSGREGYTAGETKAGDVFDALHKQESGSYVSWLCDDPIYTKIDNSGRHMWSVNLTVITHA